MDLEVAIHFRDELRAARSIALKDAEAFDELIFVIERIGVFLARRVGDLGKYRPYILAEAVKSPLAEDIPAEFPESHIPSTTLYQLMQQARNDALHQGAFARHLTNHAVELSIILEDALMAGALRARDYMVRDPVCASWWQPMSSIRRELLTNSFSFLPVLIPETDPSIWKVISDYAVAQYLCGVEPAERKKRLATRLGEAVASGQVVLEAVAICRPDEHVTAALQSSQGRPVLVIGADGSLKGIITPFDML